MKALHQIIQRACERRYQAWVLATLVETRGSTYRQPDTRMALDQEGGSIGALSGGCLEGAGLDLGSEAPEEIALSLISEIAAVLADRHGGHLRERATAIHPAVKERAKHIA